MDSLRSGVWIARSMAVNRDGVEVSGRAHNLSKSENYVD